MAARSEEATHASAMRIISIRPHSAFELRRKLLAKGADRATADRVIDRLAGVDLINDGRFARDYVEFAFLRKSWGMRKVRAGLMERGIDRAVIEDTLGTPDAAEMEREGARRFVDKQVRGRRSLRGAYTKDIRQARRPRVRVGRRFAGDQGYRAIHRGAVSPPTGGLADTAGT